MDKFPSAAATIRPLDIPSPVDQMQKVQEMQNLRQRAQIQGVQVQREQIGLQQQLQQEKDLQLYSKAYLTTNGNSDEAEKQFLQAGGSPLFAQKVRVAYDKALKDEEDRQRSISKEQREVVKAKDEKIGAALFSVSQVQDPEAQRQQFYQTAKSLMDDGTITDKEFRQAFPGGQYPGPIMLRVAALKHMEISKQVEMNKLIPVAPGGQLVNPATGEATQYGEKPLAEPTPFAEWRAQNPTAPIKDWFLTSRKGEAGGDEDANKLLTPSEATQLGVPYGTKRSGAFGKTPSKPLTAQQEQTAETGISTLDAALSIMDKMRPHLDDFKDVVNGIHFQAAINAARQSGHSGIMGTTWNAAIMRTLPEKDKKVLGDYMSGQEHIQRMRAVMQGAAGFRSTEAFETLLGQLGSPAADPKTTRETFENSYSTLKNYRDVLQRSVSGESGGTPTAMGQGNFAPPSIGTIRMGYKFKGGDPSDKNNWVKQ